MLGWVAEPWLRPQFIATNKRPSDRATNNDLAVSWGTAAENSEFGITTQGLPSAVFLLD